MTTPVAPVARPSAGAWWLALLVVVLIVLAFWIANAGATVLTALTLFILFVGAVVFAWTRLAGRA